MAIIHIVLSITECFIFQDSCLEIRSYHHCLRILNRRPGWFSIRFDLILKESGSSREKIIQMRIYIPEIELWDRVNKVYSEYFGEHKPVRCIVPTGRLHFGCLIEAEAVACL